MPSGLDAAATCNCVRFAWHLCLRVPEIRLLLLAEYHSNSLTAGGEVPSGLHAAVNATLFCLSDTTSFMVLLK